MDKRFRAQGKLKSGISDFVLKLEQVCVKLFKRKNDKVASPVRARGLTAADYPTGVSAIKFGY
jgi:hypothetical protein